MSGARRAPTGGAGEAFLTRAKAVNFNGVEGLIMDAHLVACCFVVVLTLTLLALLPGGSS